MESKEALFGQQGIPACSDTVTISTSASWSNHASWSLGDQSQCPAPALLSQNLPGDHQPFGFPQGPWIWIYFSFNVSTTPHKRVRTPFSSAAVLWESLVVRELQWARGGVEGGPRSWECSASVRSLKSSLEGWLAASLRASTGGQQRPLLKAGFRKAGTHPNVSGSFLLGILKSIERRLLRRNGTVTQPWLPVLFAFRVQNKESMLVKQSYCF